MDAPGSNNINTNLKGLLKDTYADTKKKKYNFNKIKSLIKGSYANKV